MDRTTRFLVVDDFESMRKTIRESLVRMGYLNIEMATDGHKAIELLKHQPFDCIISDWSMPLLSGIELLKFVRSEEPYKRIRFMLITAMGERDHVEHAISEGVDQFLVKPFTLAAFSEKIKSMLQRPASSGRNGESALRPSIAVPMASENSEPVGELHKKEGQVLVVDDVSNNIDFLVGLLKQKYKMRAATSGERALKICQSDEKPDLILLDIMMPEMDGYEVCKRLKADPETAHIPVIFLTAKSETVDMTRGFELGAVDYVVKPASPEVLRARVDTHVRLKRSNDNLAQQIDTLLENARLREDVERMTRHDLKNPLAAILASAESMLKSPWLPLKQKQKVEEIQEASFAMLNLINRSLDLYKMETGTYKLDARPFNLASTLAKLANDARHYAKAHGVSVILEGPESCDVLGEEILTYSMIANLLRNAVEATPQDSRVTVTLEDASGFVAIKIHNPSPVPELIRGTLFEKYVTSGKSDGNGLGTYSAKLMANVQNGDIQFRSDDQAGTEFIVSLPAATQHLRAP